MPLFVSKLPLNVTSENAFYIAANQKCIKLLFLQDFLLMAQARVRCAYILAIRLLIKQDVPS